jgi:hypothetical protein
MSQQPKELKPDEELVFTFMDRRVGKVEDELSKFGDRFDEIQRGVGQIHKVLTTLARIDAQFAAHLENTAEQRESIKRVHERLDGNAEILKAHVHEIRKEVELKMAAVNKRIDDESAECRKRFSPIEEKLHKQDGALSLALYVIPIILTIAMSGLGLMFSSMLKPFEQAAIAANEARITNERQEALLVSQDARLNNIERIKGGER